MKLIAPIEKAEDIVNKQYVDNKVSTKVENTETGICFPAGGCGYNCSG